MQELKTAVAIVESINRHAPAATLAVAREHRETFSTASKSPSVDEGAKALLSLAVSEVDKDPGSADSVVRFLREANSRLGAIKDEGLAAATERLFKPVNLIVVTLFGSTGLLGWAPDFVLAFQSFWRSEPESPALRVTGEHEIHAVHGRAQSGDCVKLGPRASGQQVD